jgi:DNA/RNA-binding domain of Phe-tRNA-synthetase-like protein
LDEWNDIVKLTIDPKVFELFPKLRIGALRARSIDNARDLPELTAELRAAEAKVRAAFPDVAALEADRRIASWQDAYRRFGTNPKRSRPSAEALLRRVVKGTELRAVNAAVDLYILSELEYLLPVGGYDVSRITGDLALRASPGGEAFVGIGETESEPTTAGEIVYADAARVLTRNWNYRDCDHAKIAAETKDLVLFIEAPDERIETTEIEAQLELIRSLLQRHCGGEVVAGMLDLSPASPSAEIRL